MQEPVKSRNQKDDALVLASLVSAPNHRGTPMYCWRVPCFEAALNACKLTTLRVTRVLARAMMPLAGAENSDSAMAVSCLVVSA